MLTVFTTHPVYADDWHEETMIQQQLDANDPSANPDFWEPTRESDTSLKFKMKVNNLLGYINTIGTVILMSKDTNTKMNEVEKKVAQSAATFLASQMEI